MSSGSGSPRKAPGASRQRRRDRFRINHQDTKSTKRLSSAVTIIGGGPAGAVAAVLLARCGWDVTVVEQQRFPRDKVCGECVSALGIDVLTRHRLEQKVQALSPVSLRRGAMVAPSGEQIRFDLPQSMWGVSRSAMDAVLLDAGRDAGARLLQPARAERVRDGGVSVRCLATNRVIDLRARHVILADGKGALAGERPRLTGDFGLKAHFSDVADRTDTISLFGLAGHYVGAAPIENGRWNVAMSVPASRLNSFRGRLDELFEQLMREKVGLARRFVRARRVSDWLVAPLPRFAVRRHCPPNVIPIGNAAAALEPIGGEGIGLALRSAELAATALIEGRPLESLPRAFDGLWQLRRGTCRLVAQLLSRPTIADAVIPFACANEAIGQLIMSCMGKRGDS